MTEKIKDKEGKVDCDKTEQIQIEQIRIFKGPAWIDSLLISPNGTEFFSSDLDCLIKKWDINTGENLNTFYGHRERILSLGIFPDGNGNRLVSNDNHTIIVWNTKSGEKLKTLTLRRCATNGIISIKISPKENKVIFHSFDGTIKAWDLNGKFIKTLLDISPFWVRSLTIFPDGTKVCFCRGDKIIQILDINNGKILKTLRGQINHLTSIAISPDGTRIISGNKYGMIQILNLLNEEIKIINGGVGYIRSIVVFPDGKKILILGRWGIIQIFDIDNEKCLMTIHNPIPISSITISPDGTKIIFGESIGLVKILQIKTQSEISGGTLHWDI
jgi:WD40 repeat protein